MEKRASDAKGSTVTVDEGRKGKELAYFVFN